MHVARPYLSFTHNCGALLLLICTLICTMLWAVLASPTWAQQPSDPPETPSGEDYIVIGQSEQVILSAPDRSKELQVQAKIDTGADRTSIDTELVQALGIELDSSRTVTIITGSGEEERPLVDVVLMIAGQTKETTVSVNDRSQLSTKMIIGQNDLTGFLVSTAQDQLTSPKGQPPNVSLVDQVRSAFETEVFALGPEALLALIPFAAVLVAAFRTLVGLRTYGIFAPILIAISLTETGVFIGSAMFVLVVVAGIVVEPVLRALRLSRTSRLAVLLTIVVLTLLAVKAFLNYFALGAVLAAAFPAVITVAIIEQLWERWEREGLKKAATISLWTALIIVATGFILTIEVVQIAATQYPVAMAGLSVVLCLLLGRYRGLRVTELLRFQPMMSQKDAR